MSPDTLAGQDPFGPLEELASGLVLQASEAWCRASENREAGDDEGHEREAMEAEMLDQASSLIRRAIAEGRAIAGAQ